MASATRTTAWAVGVAGVLAACGGDRPAATAPPRPAPSGEAAVAPTTTSAPTTTGAVGVHLELAAPAATARTVGVRLGAQQGRVAIGADGAAQVVLVAEHADAPILVGDRAGTGRLALPIAAAETALPAALTAEGPLVRPEVLAVHVGAGAAPVDLVIDRSPDATAFAAVRAGVWRLPGEQAATSAGVIDLVDGGAYYQGAPGPLSHARYVALARPVDGPQVPCDGGAVGSVELDVTVFDRFAGNVAGKQRFRPAAGCSGLGAGALRVDPAAVRHWLRTQFVRTSD